MGGLSRGDTLEMCVVDLRSRRVQVVGFNCFARGCGARRLRCKSKVEFGGWRVGEGGGEEEVVRVNRAR
jgi:hypothetical protein